MMIGAVISLTGSIFLLLAAVGIIRMPDLYNRMQTGTKATTLGAGLFLTGIAVAVPGWTAKMVLLILFIMFTNPVSSHALARASHFIGVTLGKGSEIDELAGENYKEGPWKLP